MADDLPGRPRPDLPDRSRQPGGPPPGPPGERGAVPAEAREYRDYGYGPPEEVGLEEVWAVLRRRWRTIAAVMAVVLAATAWWTWQQDPVWAGATTLRVEDESRGLMGGRAEGLLLGQPPSEIETEMRVVTARPILEEVVDRLNLTARLAEPAGLPRDFALAWLETGPEVTDARYAFSRQGANRWRVQRVDEGAPPGGDTRTVAAGDTVGLDGVRLALADEATMREAVEPVPDRLVLTTRSVPAAVGALRASLSVARPDPDASLLTIRYQDTDRFLARTVPNALTEAFLARRQTVQKTEARSTVDFLEEQSDRIEEQLQEAESQLQSFREQEQVIAPESQAEAQVRRLADLRARRSELVAERTALRQLLRSVEGDEAGTGAYRKVATFPTFLQNQGVQNLFERLVEARQRRTEMLSRRTRRHPEVVALTEQIDQLESQLAEVARNYLGSLNDQIAALETELARFGSDLEQIPGEEVQFARLKRRTEVLTELNTMLQKRLKEAEISEAVEDPSVRVVEAAVLPRSPVSPKPMRNMTFAGFLGLVLGVGIAFVREYTDRRIHSEEDVDRSLGAPILTRVPRVPTGDGESFPRSRALVAATEGRSLPAESYRTLRTNVRYSRPGKDGTRQLVVTSPGARDGKSITAANLAITFAQQGQRTLLVDADLRKPVQHEAFEVERWPGLTDHLVDGFSPADLIRTTGIDRLFVMPAGSSAPNPAELLDSEAMEELLEQLKEGFDAVVIDTPPALVVTDASVLGARVEGVLVVVRADQTDRGAAEETMEQLRHVGCDVLGVVFNDADRATGYGYKYQYYYDQYYGEDGDEERRAKWKRLLPFG